MASIYKKIPGVGTGWRNFQIASRSRLYAAPDHLLVLHSTGYTEEYKRLFFRDIRFFEVRPTKRQFWIGLVSAILALILLPLYYVSVPIVLVAVFCFPFVLVFLVNLLRGPTCECYLGTSVQTLRLPAPSRVKKVAAMIQFLRVQTAAFASVEAPQSAA
jgi:integral membrane sensor domain MASE1